MHATTSQEEKHGSRTHAGLLVLKSMPNEIRGEVLLAVNESLLGASSSYKAARHSALNAARRGSDGHPELSTSCCRIMRQWMHIHRDDLRSVAVTDARLLLKPLPRMLLILLDPRRLAFRQLRHTRLDERAALQREEAVAEEVARGLCGVEPGREDKQKGANNERKREVTQRHISVSAAPRQGRDGGVPGALSLTLISLKCSTSSSPNCTSTPCSLT